MKQHTWKTAFALCAIFLATAIPTMAQKYETLVNFNITNGNDPWGTLVQGLDGNLYGTTYFGGSNNTGCNSSFNFGCGTVFKVGPDGNVTVLYQFCAEQNCVDGGGAIGLVLGTDGNFYGTTTEGWYHGTLYKITPQGKLTTILHFSATPSGGLVQGKDGNLYGTTYDGGSTDQQCAPYGGCGTVFKVTPGGELTTLYSFSGLADGNDPTGLTLGTDGNFYGTTYMGGAVNAPVCAPSGCGTLFRITPTGTLTTVASFLQVVFPEAPPIEGSDGNFYGTSFLGGASDAAGTVYRVTPNGVVTVLHSFCSVYNCVDGEGPQAPLIQASDGNFYGTTSGIDAWGEQFIATLFRMTPAGDLTTLVDLQGGANSGLVQYTDGVLYGTTPGGGNSTNCVGYGCGTLFSLDMGLSPFVESSPLSGKAGATVKILGTKLTGATSVTFNGIAASFRVVSATQISTTVPTGATTGPVQVVTPSGTLTSNVNFQILP